jgi:3-hydroxybutyrate dehydrogenase
VAAHFAAAGDRVFLAGRNAAKVAAAVDELSALGRVVPLVFDVADAAATQAAFAEVGQLDVVVAAAGVCQQAHIDEPHGDAVWTAALNVNLSGAYYTLKAGAARLAQGGVMLAVSSGLGKNGRAGYEAYCASKHGLLGLVKCLALELSTRGVRVNAVCPGWVDTPMSRADLCVSARRSGLSPAAQQAQALARIPLGRMVKATEVAGLIGFLCSDAASAITGEAYNLSGGEFSN